VALIIFHYLRYRLSYENVAEIFWLRGFKLCAETIRLWVLRFGILLGKNLRSVRRGKAGKSWYVDETYLQVEGEWCYLYRARDKQGELIDCFLSPTRDKASAVRFFKQAINVVGHAPDRITTDKNPAYPGAIEEAFATEVTHRTNKYLNNLEEQDHRDIKSRYYSMKGFKDFMLCTGQFLDFPP
jgi:putative transposase